MMLKILNNIITKAARRCPALSGGVTMCSTRVKKCFLTFLATMFVVFFVSGSTQAASVVTDLADYPPGATVTITGSGFESLENVSVLVEHVNDSVTGGE